jgi:hypothetical protein
MIEQAWVAGVAGAMFMLDTAHGGGVGWISNRSSLMGACFGVVALLCHHESRKRARPALGALAAASLLTGMFCAELTLGTLGYLMSYALFVERSSVTQRLRSLLPYAPVLLAWGIYRRAAGYGSYGMYAYVDPVREPLVFVQGLPARLALLFASQTARLNADLYQALSPDAQPWFVLAAFASTGIVLWFVWFTLRASRDARFWASGALLSAVPLAATQPSDRLLTLVGLGVMPLLAQAMHDALSPLAAGAQVAARTRFATLLAALHLVLAPLMLPVASLAAAMLDRVLQTAEASLPDAVGVSDQTVIAVAIPDSLFVSYLQVMRWVQQKPRPRRLYWLVSTQAQVRLERRATDVLRVTPEGGFFARTSEARAAAHPLLRGERIELSDMTVQVMELTAKGEPAVCDFVFRKPLDSAEYVWRTWRDGQFVMLQLPPVGQSMSVSAL